VRKVLFILVALLFSVADSSAQKDYIDSLEFIAKRLEGREQIDVLLKVSFELLSYENVKANKIANEAYLLSKKINYKLGEAQALLFMGSTQSIFGNKTKSSHLIKQSIRLSEEIKANSITGYGLTFLGANYEKSNQLDSAFISYNRAFELLSDSTAPYYLSYLYLHLADYYKAKYDSESQLKYLKKCWAIREKLNEKKYLVWVGELIAAYYTEQGQFAESKSYLNRIQLELGKDTVDNEEISFIYRQRAIVYINEGQFSVAFRLLSKAKKYFERVNDQYELMNTKSEIGYVFMDIANYELSLENYFEALTIAEKFQYESEQTKILARIGWVYYELKQTNQSTDFTNRALLLARKNHFRAEESFALNLLGLLAARQNRNEDALAFFKQALQIRTSLGAKNGIASTQLNIGQVLEKQGKLQEALGYNLQSLSIEQSTGHQIGLAYTYQSLGQLFTKLRVFDKAEYYLSKGESLAKEIQAGSVLIDVIRNKRDLSLEQKKYQKAIEYSLQYDAIKDSIFDHSITERISNLQNVYQVGQKDNEILILNQQKELQGKKLEILAVQLSQQRLIIFIGSLGVILLIAFSYLMYRYYVKIKSLNREIQERSEEIQTQSEELSEANKVLSELNREILEQKEEIQAQTEELQENNAIISQINETLELKVDQRTRELKQSYKELDTFFYRSSHDFRRPLTTFMGLAEVAKITLKDAVALDLFDKVNDTARNLDKMLFKLQSISELSVQELIQREIFLLDLFRDELLLFNKDLLRLKIKVELDVSPSLSFYSCYGLLKVIVNNLIENSIVFSRPIEPFIRLSACDQKGRIVIKIEDNGCGIPKDYHSRVFEMYVRANEQSKGNGLGLFVVKRASDKLEGIITLTSELDKGTTVEISFPNQIS